MRIKAYLEDKVSLGGVTGDGGTIRQVDELRTVVVHIKDRDVNGRVSQKVSVFGGRLDTKETLLRPNVNFFSKTCIAFSVINLIIECREGDILLLWGNETFI